ncbi:MAG: AAA family ATPase [Lachnospira sp.]|nr:AAA family ATPase [Lachnospira sp.]
MQQEVVVIAIDGMSAAGKTTLSVQLEKEFGASVIHCDDFFLPKELRTLERLAEPGGNIDYNRMKKEVIDQLNRVRKSGSDFVYQRFDCKTMDLADSIVVKQSKLYVVEGAYAMHPHFGRYYDISVYLRIDGKKQLERIKQRNGDTTMFEERWIPMENRYADEFDIVQGADIVADAEDLQIM